MDSAWMVRNDGKAIVCVQHIYANTEDIEETLFAADWLYVSTHHEKTRQIVLETVTAWASSILNRDIISDTQKVIAQKSYRFLSQEFVTILLSIQEMQVKLTFIILINKKNF